MITAYDAFVAGKVAAFDWEGDGSQHLARTQSRLRWEDRVPDYPHFAEWGVRHALRMAFFYGWMHAGEGTVEA